MKIRIGIKERLQYAESIEELDAIEREVMGLPGVPAKTRRRWQRIYDRRSAALSK